MKILTFILAFVTINLYFCNMLRAYQYRIYPTQEQTILINKHLGCVRWLYNYALDKKITAYQKDKTQISRFDLQAELPILKKQKDTEWLAEVNSQSLQATLRNLDMAYTRFFKHKKGFPKFKSKHNNRQSFQIPQRVKVNWDNSTITVPNIKVIPVVLSRKFKGIIKTVTISKTPTNKYFISILVDTDIKPEKKPKIKEATTIGIDLGLTHFATLSTGEKIDNPRYLREAMSRLKVLQRRLSKKVKGSNNRKKTRLKVARQHEKITNKRTDFLHKLTYKLTHESQVQTICIEDLAVSNMVKNHNLALSISDVSWGKFKQLLTYKCDWYGKNLITIGRFEPSSKLCTCGKLNNDLTLSDRNWTCKYCKITHDRDILAANNIKRMGLHPKNTGAGCSSELLELPTIVGAMKEENPLTN